MNLEIAIFANAADALPDGRLFIHGGGVDQLNCIKFPSKAGTLYLIIRTRGTIEEIKESRILQVEITAPSGELIGERFSISLPPLKEGHPIARKASHNIIVNISEIPLQSQGEYSFKLFIDDKFIGDTSFTAVEAAKGE